MIVSILHNVSEPRRKHGCGPVNPISVPNDHRWATTEGVAMTMTNNPSASGGRRVKFTPQAIEKIKEFVAAGISRDEIANLLGVTVGSLQVTCSRLGISLRRIILPNGSGRPHGRGQGKDCSCSLRGWHCARARAEGSIAAGSPPVRDNDAMPRRREND